MTIFLALLAAVTPVAPLSDAGVAERQDVEMAAADARRVAMCVIDRRPFEAKAVLQANNTTEFETARARIRRTLSKCADDMGAMYLSATYETKASGLIGILAEAWLRSNGTPAPSPGKIPDKSSLTWTDEGTDRQIVLNLAACLAAARPDVVAGVLRSEPSSSAEVAAFSGLSPFIAGCLDKNVTLTIRPTDLRFALAAALYRRAFVTNVSEIEGRYDMVSSSANAKMHRADGEGSAMPGVAG